MKLGDKIPVPELDELRVARIERAVVEAVATAQTPPMVRPERSYRRTAFALASVAALVLAVFYVLQDSKVDLLDRPWASGEPTQITTGPGESSSLRLGDAEVKIGARTQVSVERFSDGRTVLHLGAGSVHCEVKPRPNRPTFQVLSGDVTVTVVGTAFDVTRSQIVEVKVERGIVSVETSHDEVKLLAGDDWQGSPHAHTTLATLLAKRETIDGVGTLVVDNQGGPDEGTAAVAKNSKDNLKTPRTPRTPKNMRDGGPGKAPKTIKLSEVLLSAKPLPPIYKQSHSDELSKLKQVAAANPKEAVHQLQAYAAKTKGSEASFALYTRAYLLFFKLKQYSLAIKTAKQYDRRFPRGAESEDMLWLRVRASCAANKFSSCRAASHTSLRRYPKGVFQGLASRIVTTTKTE